MNMVRVPGPAGTYEVPVHRAPLHTRVLQGVGLAAFLTVFRMAAYLRSPKEFSMAQLALLFGAVSSGGAVGGVVYYEQTSGVSSAVGGRPLLMCSVYWLIASARSPSLAWSTG